MIETRRRLPAGTGVALLGAAVVPLVAGCGGERAPSAQGPRAHDGYRIEVLVRGAALHGANGVHFDPDGRLWVASVLGRELAVIDPDSGTVLERYGPEDGVECPDDVTIAPDGTAYWTAICTGEVGARASDGSVRRQQVGPGVNPVTLSDDGRLFVARDFLGDGLYELDPGFAAPPRRIRETLGWLNGMDWGPDGGLYGPIWTGGRIVRADPESGDLETVADGIGVVSAVKFSPAGELHASSYTTGEMLRIDRATGEREVVGRVPPAVDNLAFDSRGRLFASHARDGAIYEILDDVSTRTVTPGGLIAPGGIALVERETGSRIHVADVFSLRAFDAETGEALAVETHFFAVPGGITAPMTVTAGPGGRLVLASWLANAVQVWDPGPDTALVTWTDFATPLAAAWVGDDILVAQLGTSPGAGSVVRIPGADPTARDTLATGLAVPAGLAATAAGDVWVSEWTSGRVLKLATAGDPGWTPLPVAIGLERPEGIALAPDGSLLIVEAGAGRLSRLRVGSEQAEPLAEGLEIGLPAPEAWPPVWISSGVAAASDGTIFVTGDRGNLIYRIDPPP